jgi:serine/threonine protein kinase
MADVPGAPRGRGFHESPRFEPSGERDRPTELQSSHPRRIMSEPESGQADRIRDQSADGDHDVDVAAHDSSGTGLAPSAEETAALLKQLTVGTTVEGKYRVDEIIGKGAMGVVLAATHIHLKERVALKFLATRAHAQADDFHSRFRREAQVSAKLRNEHITRVLDVGMWREKIPFMVMDLLTGDDLRRTLRQAPEGRLSASTALDYIVQICEGLAEAHSHGIVHRDLKPSNLFVTKRHDGSDLIKILDFGISKWSAQEDQLEELTQTGVVLGSPKYMAPEQLFGSSTVDPRADIWSIGAIFYEMLTGRPPYDFPTLTRICAELAADRPPPTLMGFVPDLPPGLEAVVMRCFARDREHRVSNVAELAGDLLDAVDAPFASQVRQKIGSMLDPKGMGSQLVSSSGAMALGTPNYRSLSMTGSIPSVSSSAALRAAAEAIPPSAATAGGVEAEAAGGAPEANRRKTLVVLALAAVLAGAAVLFFAFSGGHAQETTKGAPLASSPSVGVAAQVPTAPAPPAPVTPLPVAATAPVGEPSIAQVSAPAATPASPAAPRAHAGGGGAGVHRGGAKPAPAPPAAATPQAPTAAPPPVPAPAPTPAPPKANPLEDRQ